MIIELSGWVHIEGDKVFLKSGDFKVEILEDNVLYLNIESHVAFNKIRTVHISSFQRIHSIPNGKITITDENDKIVIEAALKEMCGM